jgi:hypothetical protein
MVMRGPIEKLLGDMGSLLKYYNKIKNKKMRKIAINLETQK